MDSQFLVYSVYDVKAQRYGPLFEAGNDEVAGRQFVHLMQSIQPIFRPEYQLFCVGFFDFVTGELSQNQPPKQIPLVYDLEKIGEVKR